MKHHFVFVPFYLLWSVTAQAQGGGGGLGRVEFPTSTDHVEAQREFLTGVELLHNFEYEEALEAMQRARQLDPDFAMAYWGKAMSHNHPLWQEQDTEDARAVLTAMGSLSLDELTEREKGFLRAVRLLYGAGDKAERDRAHAEEMAKLYERFPDDFEVASFYALAVLGARRGSADAMWAAAILEELFTQRQDHPGMLHYLIHCYEDSTHAPLGLRAARWYDKVATASAHALHMPSHIYLPLGMWDEFVASNERAWRAGEERLERRKLGHLDFDVHALHALQWVQYGYLQQGRYDEAFSQLELMLEVEREKNSPMAKWYLAFMKAAYVVDAPDWDRAAAIEIGMQGVELSAAASERFAMALASIRRGDTGAEGIRQEIAALREEAEEQHQSGHHTHHSYFTGVYSEGLQAARIVDDQVEALILLADGRPEEAVRKLQAAAAEETRMPHGYGPPTPVKPTDELLGEVLLNLNRPAEALASFERVLERTSRRVAALRGLAEAARRLKDDAVSSATLAEIRKIQKKGARGYQSWIELPGGKRRLDGAQ